MTEEDSEESYEIRPMWAKAGRHKGGREGGGRKEGEGREGGSKGRRGREGGYIAIV